MSKRSRIIAGWIAGLALAGGLHWALFPKIRTTTVAELRAYVAPELLLPLPQVAANRQRHEVVQQALRELLGNWRPATPRNAARVGPLDLRVPQVRRVLDMLEAGPLERPDELASVPQPGPQLPSWQLVRFTSGLAAAALEAARQHDWERAGRQIEAASLLLDRMAESDVVLPQSRYTLGAEDTVHGTILELAASNPPASLGGRLAALLSVERHGPEQVRRILRSEFQLRMFPELQAYPFAYSGPTRRWVPLGSYDPLETVTLISDRFVEAGGNAGLPASRRSTAAADRIQRLAGGPQLDSSSMTLQLLDAACDSLRLNISGNAMGRRLARSVDPEWMWPRMNAVQTRREQVAAALAVVRFRQRTGREPRGFDELVAAQLLPAVPRDHATGAPLAFDLQQLFQWPAGIYRPAP